MTIRARSSRLSFLAAPVLALALLGAAPRPAAAEIPGLRVGLSGAVGGFGGSISGLYGGAQGRIGIQWTRSFATYFMGQGMIGGFVPTPSGGANAVGIWLNAFMLEGTVDIVQLGFGPAFDFFWGCDATPSQTACGSVGPYFGLDARGALRFGLFTLSLDVHPIFLSHDSSAVFVTLGFGLDV